MASRNPHPLILAALALALLTLTFVARAQTGPPPVKMGLWQLSTTRNMTGMTLPPEVVEKMKAMGRPLPGGEHTTVTQNCLTEEQWKEGLGGTPKSDQQKCAPKNFTRNAHQLSFDIDCTDPRGGRVVGRMEFIFDNPEHLHGTVNMNSTQIDAQHSNIVMSTKIDGHYISSNCGDVKPGNDKVISNR